MQPILRTDTDQVRAVMGIDEKDMSDAQITGGSIDKELRLNLISWLPNYDDLYLNGVGSGDASEDIADAIVLYSTYYCASLVAVSAQLATPLKVGDGKNTLERFSPMNWDALNGYLQDRAQFYKKFLQDATKVKANAVMQMLTGVGLSVDPVTGV